MVFVTAAFPGAKFYLPGSLAALVSLTPVPALRPPDTWLSETEVLNSEPVLVYVQSYVIGKTIMPT